MGIHVFVLALFSAALGLMSMVNHPKRRCEQEAALAVQKSGRDLSIQGRLVWRNLFPRFNFQSSPCSSAVHKGLDRDGQQANAKSYLGLGGKVLLRYSLVATYCTHLASPCFTYHSFTCTHLASPCFTYHSFTSLVDLSG